MGKSVHPLRKTRENSLNNPEKPTLDTSQLCLYPRALKMTGDSWLKNITAVVKS